MADPTYRNVTNSTNISSYEDILNHQRAPWWAMTIIAILTLVALGANFLILTVFVLESKVRTVFNSYLISLAFSDFVAGAMSMPYSAFYTYYGYWPFNYRQCTVWQYFDCLATGESLVMLMVIALDRLCALTWPIRYRKYHTASKCHLIIIFTWIFSNVVLVPPLVFSRMFVAVVQNPYECLWQTWSEPRWASALFVSVLGEWIPVTICVLAYVLTILGLWQKSWSRPRIGLASVRKAASIQPRDRQAFFLLSLLIAALVVQWGPWFIYQGLQNQLDYYNEFYFFSSYWLAYALSATNPFLFNLGSPEMRQGMLRLWNCSLGHKKEAISSQSLGVQLSWLSAPRPTNKPVKSSVPLETTG